MNEARDNGALCASSTEGRGKVWRSYRLVRVPLARRQRVKVTDGRPINSPDLQLHSAAANGNVGEYPEAGNTGHPV